MFLIIDIIDFFFKIGFYLITYCNNSLNEMKYSIFNGYFISYAIFQVDEKKFIWIYNYDKPWNIIYLYFMYILGFDIPNNLISINNAINLNKMNYIIVASYILNNKQEYIMTDDLNINNLYENQVKEKFIYVTLDESCDLTHEFEKFKYYILFNKYLECRDFVTILQIFFNNIETIKNDSTLKLMIDDTYDEKIYKGNDLLLIN
jgi:hypothetical protein